MAKKVEEAKQKKVVKVTYVDGIGVEKGAEGLLTLRSPVQLNIPPNAKVEVDMGLRFGSPVLVVQTAGMKRRRIFFDDGPVTSFDANEKVVLTFANLGSDTALVEARDALARAHVLDDTDVDVQ